MKAYHQFYSRCVAAAVLWLMAVRPSGQAQTTIVGWDMNGVSEDVNMLGAATFATGIGATAPSGVLSRGAGAALPGLTASNAFGASGFSSASLSTALAGNDYFSFSFAVDTGYSVTLSSITLKMFATTNGPTNAALFSSVGGFASTDVAIQLWPLTGNANNDQTITLSSSAFANLTGTTEFRLYAYGSGTASTDKLRFRNLTGNDLTLTGTVSAVPEPSVYASLTGAAAFAATLVFRSRRPRRPAAQKSPLSRIHADGM